MLGSLVAALLFGASFTEAQVQDNGWSAPFRLSNGDRQAFDESSVVTDQYGYVHAFWFESVSSDDYPLILYARFDGEIWSQPVDIYVAKEPGNSLHLLSPVVDQNGTLHIIWTEGRASRQYSVYYMRASAYDALSAWSWSKPRLIDVPAHLIGLQVDSKGTLHLLYSSFFGSDPGVHYLRSNNYGETWSDHIWLDPDIPSGHGPASLQFVLDETDGLHTLWHYEPVDALGGDWIRYAHSLDGGASWSSPVTIDKDEEGSGKLRMPGPVMAVQDQTVHVIWGAVSNTAILRYHRFSTDVGRTWTDSNQVFGNLNGQAEDGLAVDGAGRVHFLGQIRYPQGIYHAYWDEDHWVGPSLIYLIARDAFESRGSRIHAHGLRPVVRAGNQLVITFHPPASDPDRSIYTMHRTLGDVAPVTPQPAETPTPVSRSTTLASTPTPLPAGSPEQPNLPDFAALPTARPKVGMSIWWGVAPVILLVFASIVFSITRNRR